MFTAEYLVALPIGVVDGGKVGTVVAAAALLAVEGTCEHQPCEDRHLAALLCVAGMVFWFTRPRIDGLAGAAQRLGLTFDSRARPT